MRGQFIRAVSTQVLLKFARENLDAISTRLRGCVWVNVHSSGLGQCSSASPPSLLRNTPDRLYSTAPGTSGSNNLRSADSCLPTGCTNLRPGGNSCGSSGLCCSTACIGRQARDSCNGCAASACSNHALPANFGWCRHTDLVSLTATSDLLLV